jgi:hypothetical protein
MTYKREYPRDMSFIDRQGKLIKPSKKHYYSTLGKREEKQGHYGEAYKMYENAGDYKKAKEMIEKQKSKYKSIDRIVSAIMLISGIFLFAYFLNLPSQVAVQGSQLAPPMPSTAIVVVSLLLIAGVIYFMYTRAIKKRYSIPLSFQ